jgi:hypothetical protein
MIPAADLKALTERYGRIKHVTYNGNDLVFRKPSRAEVQQHRKNANGADKESADEQLSQVLIVRVNGITEPESAREAFLNLLDEWPYLTASPDVGRAVCVLSGLVQDESLKK